MQTSKTKSLYFFLSAALHTASKDVGTCARKLNPSLDQSEHFIKKKGLFQHSFQDVLSMCPWAIKENEEVVYKLSLTSDYIEPADRCV